METRFRAIVADLVADVTSGTYDPTKTVTRGRITSKLLDAKTCLGAPLNKFIDCFNDAAITPSTTLHLTPSGRLFVAQAIATGAGTIGLWTVSFTDMEVVYVGKIIATYPNLAATTHTMRYFKALDTSTANWKIYVGTLGSVTINGGTFCLNKIDLADFVPVGFPTIPFATGNDQKAVYFNQDPAFVGSNHNTANLANVATAGGLLDRNNNRLYVHDGLAASHRYHVYDTSAAPAWTGYSVTGLASTDVISHAGHPFVNGDQVTFTQLTGGAGLLTTVAAYFVVNSVPGVSYQLSLTTGGAAINFTTDITSATIGRAYGISTTQFLHRTGNLPALVGTLLLTDSEDYAEPAAINASIDGFPCAFFATTSNLYIGRLSELTAGTTSWPSLQSVNIFATINAITAPTTLQAAWSDVLQRVVYATNTALFVLKKFLNNSADYVFGGINNEYHEGYPGKQVIPLGVTLLSAMDLENGILACSSSTVGQRGVFLCDVRSQAEFDYSYIITKVLDTPDSVYRYLATFDKLFEFTGANLVEYRTTGFAVETGNWLPLPYGEELMGIVTPGDQVQFKIYSDHLGLDTCIPAQIYDVLLGLESKLDNSEHWSSANEQTTKESEFPPKSAAVLVKSYASGVVPEIKVRAYSRATGSLVLEKSTVTHAAEFDFSSNSGGSFSALGTIPNVINTTRLRYNWSAPIPEDVDIVWREA